MTALDLVIDPACRSPCSCRSRCWRSSASPRCCRPVARPTARGRTSPCSSPRTTKRPGCRPRSPPFCAQLEPGDRLLVVADNCTDHTAAVARAAGAEVLERRDAERRGKGYALAAGVDTLRAGPPDVVVIVDADCRPAAGAIDRLVRTPPSLPTGRSKPLMLSIRRRPPSAGQSIVGLGIPHRRTSFAPAVCGGSGCHACLPAAAWHFRGGSSATHRSPAGTSSRT